MSIYRDGHSLGYKPIDFSSFCENFGHKDCTDDARGDWLWFMAGLARLAVTNVPGIVCAPGKPRYKDSRPQ